MTLPFVPDDPIAIDGAPNSTDLIERIAEAPILLAFSGGKDAIAAALHLIEHDIDFRPYHMQVVPGLDFVNDHLDYCETWIGRTIDRIPHPMFWRWLATGVFATPALADDMAAADLPDYTYDDVRRAVAEDHNLDPTTTLCADGVRAADSIVRRTAIATHGPIRSTGKASVVWDYRIRHVREIIAKHNITLPIDYQWFGRSFDGLDRRFLEPIRANSQQAWDRITHFFPLANLEATR